MRYPISEVKKACNGVLAKTFPKIEIYGNDAKDILIRPAFFTEIMSRSYKADSPYIRAYGYTFKATLFEQVHNENYCLNIFEMLLEAFGVAVKTEKGWLTVEEIGFEWVDEYADKMQITVQFAPMKEVLKRREEGELMRNMELELRRREV